VQLAAARCAETRQANDEGGAGVNALQSQDLADWAGEIKSEIAAARDSAITAVEQRAALAELTTPKPRESVLAAPFEIPVRPGAITVGFIGDEPALLIEESSQHPGFWHLLDVRDSTVSSRPVRADAVSMVYCGHPDASLCDWTLKPAAGECTAETA
jgi:hypothetical protein